MIHDPRAALGRATVVEARAALVRAVQRAAAPARPCAEGLLDWLVAGAAICLGIGDDPTLEELTRLAWHVDVKPATLSNRFRTAKLHTPREYIDAMRAAAIGWCLSRGVTIADLARAEDRRPRDFYRFMSRMTPPAMRSADVLGLMRQRRPEWARDLFLTPLLSSIPSGAWWHPQVLASRRD